MKYTVLILPRAEKSLGRLPVEDFRRVLNALLQLKKNPRPSSALKLATRKGWRLRVGRYRVVYEIEDSTRTVVILDIGHRREVYRRILRH